MSKRRSKRPTREDILDTGQPEEEPKRFEYLVEIEEEPSWRPDPKKAVKVAAAIGKKREARSRAAPEEVDLEELQEVLEAVPNEDLHYDDWLVVGMALHSTGHEEALELWQEWSEKSPKHVASYCDEKWKTFDDDRDDGVHLGTVYHMALEEGWRPAKADPRDDFAEVLGENGKTSKLSRSSKTLRTVQDDSPSVRSKKPSAGNGALVPLVRPGADFETGAKGQVLLNVRNAVLAVEGLDLGLQYDEFGDRIVMIGPGYVALEKTFPGTPRVFEDFTIDAITWAVSRRTIDLPPAMVLRAVVTAARHHRFNPIADWLDFLEWDGERRLDSWLQDLCKAKDRPYERACGRILLLGAVARAYVPGIKFDSLVVLEGRQGTGKSTLVQILGGDYASEGLPARDLRDRDVVDAMRGKWFIEFEELDAARKADVQTLKSFLSRTEDRARLAYDRTSRDFPRRCVFMGTTNEKLYLRDDTGARRMLPVEVGQIDLTEAARVRDQLFAEAVQAWKGDPTPGALVLPRALWSTAAEEQEQRRSPDAWEEAIEDYLSGGEEGDPVDRATGGELLRAVGLPVAQCQRFHFSRVAAIMARLGWERSVYKEKGRLVKGYVDPGSEWQECLQATRVTRPKKSRPEAWKKRQRAARRRGQR